MFGVEAKEYYARADVRRERLLSSAVVGGWR